MSENVSISKTIKGNSSIDELPFVKIKEFAIGKKYELSLVFVGDKKAQSLNKKYRNKSYIPNVLSFPINKNSGEIFINANVAKKEAPLFGHDFKSHVLFLFIHALMHLKGFAHGSRMERAEARIRKNFGFDK